ncbi:MAG: sigma-70 family RNA polymerase sigma factor [Acidobacteria bacterium]|nr:sigma-70 family RNA polymerase sigma factor [Acidobacteriota bacterium]MBI3426908.1 sigma-70 family RNA polymerase sigma factor [Acidobacteriota bacterium]
MSAPSSPSVPAATQAEVSRLLAAWGQGDAEALSNLLPLVYDELRRLADSYLRRERDGHTLQPTALVHEAFLRLIGHPPQLAEAESRAHFFGIAAQVMRQVLVDHARAHAAAKRGGAWQRISLTAAQFDASVDAHEIELLALDQALTRLAAFDPQLARLVELRYFADLTIEETAHVLGLSPATIKREWQTARTWLQRELRRGEKMADKPEESS